MLNESYVLITVYKNFVQPGLGKGWNQSSSIKNSAVNNNISCVFQDLSAFVQDTLTKSLLDILLITESKRVELTSSSSLI